MTSAILHFLYWYIPGLVFPIALRWIYSETERKRFFCAAPITYFLGVLAALTGWIGAIAGVIVGIIVGVSILYEKNSEKSWLTRPICDPDKE